VIVCGISTGFPVLFPTPGQITHVLLTRAPLYSGSCPPFLARLACVRHAASVDSEPGSNSQDFLMRLILRWVSPTRFALKTELTRKILLAVRFLFSKNQIGSQASNWRQKNRLNLLGGVFNEPCAQQPIRCQAHLVTIGMELMTVKHRFQFLRRLFSPNSLVELQSGLDVMFRIYGCTPKLSTAETHGWSGFQAISFFYRCMRMVSSRLLISLSFFSALSLSIITRSKGSVPEYRTTRRPLPCSS
jgi:hypothetical protein